MVGHQPRSCEDLVCHDPRLDAALEELTARATRLDAWPSGEAVREALARAGYPGDAQVSVTRGSSAFPLELRGGEPASVPRDVAWASRRFVGSAADDADTWWVYAWAPRTLEMSLVPRDLSRGESLPLRVDGPGPLRLLHAPPTGSVEELSLSPGRLRLLSGLTETGEHRIEVIRDESVELLFSVWVDSAPPPPMPLPGPELRPSAETMALDLRSRAEALRTGAGLPRLEPYAPFVPLAEVQAACLARLGRLLHDSATCPSVARRAGAAFYPLAAIAENLALASSVDEAWSALYASPGHRRNLLCDTCTHDSLAVVADAYGSLWIVWEFINFPAGFPRPHLH